jgi:hypothetical protein
MYMTELWGPWWVSGYIMIIIIEIITAFSFQVLFVDRNSKEKNTSTVTLLTNNKLNDNIALRQTSLQRHTSPLHNHLLTRPRPCLGFYLERTPIRQW